MKYQLVVQWPADSVEDYDAIVEIEDALIRRLSSTHEVDGHDAGVGEANLFIHTDDPAKALDELQNILTSGDFWVGAKVAYRQLGGEDYIILWPPTLRDFKLR